MARFPTGRGRAGPVLPLYRDAAQRFLPRLIAVMVFLLAVTMTGMILVRGLTAKWNGAIDGAVTILLAPVRDPALSETERRGRDRDRMEKLMTIVENTSGIATATPLNTDRMRDLLSPWLGRDDIVGDLALPRIVELTPSRDEPLRIGVLEERLRAELPGAELDDHRLWLEGVMTLAGFVELVMLGMIALVMAATVSAVVFATRSGLAVHREIIDLLHVIGAHDDYVARQFALHAQRLGLKGGLLGLALSVGPVVVLALLAARAEQFRPIMLADPLFWLMLAAIAPSMALVARLTARHTVLRTLRDML